MAKEIQAEKDVKAGTVGLDKEQAKKINVFFNLLSTGQVTPNLLTSLFKEPFYDKVLIHHMVTHKKAGYGNLIGFLMFDHEAGKCLIDVVSALGNKAIKKTLINELKEGLGLAQRSLGVPMFQKQAMALAFFIDEISQGENDIMKASLETLKYATGASWVQCLYDVDCLAFVLNQQPDFFIEHDGFEAIHQLTNESSIFYELCKIIEDKNSLLPRYWELLKASVSSERLFSLTTKSGETPFYELCKHKEGIKLIESDFSFFQTIITVEGFHQTIHGDGLNHNRSAFFELMSSGEGLAFLSKHWSFFKNLIRQEQLHRPRIIPSEHYRKFMKNGDEQSYEIDGSDTRGFYMAETPFHHCTVTNHGLALMAHDLDFFLRDITAEQLHASMDVPNIQDACTPFESLCCRVEGVNFITNHWQQYFQSKVSIEDLKSKYSQQLATSLIDDSLFVSEAREPAEMRTDAHRDANLMYLAAQVNHDVFFERWQKDSKKYFLKHKMANGKSAFVNLNEKAHFNLNRFSGKEQSKLVVNLEREYRALHAQLTEDSPEDDIVLLLHLASCHDINFDSTNRNNNFLTTKSLINKFKLLGIDWQDRRDEWMPGYPENTSGLIAMLKSDSCHLNGEAKKSPGKKEKRNNKISSSTTRLATLGLFSKSTSDNEVQLKADAVEGSGKEDVHSLASNHFSAI